MFFQKRVVTSASKKQVVVRMKKTFNLSERQACQLVGVSRTGFRYAPKTGDDEHLRNRLRKLAAKHASYGYLFLHRLLRQEGLVTNKKRTYRIYTEEGLQVRTKKRKGLIRNRTPMIVPIVQNVRWSMDFVSDQLSNGRRLCVLNVIDDYLLTDGWPVNFNID
jgi:putative transposase